jgi:hypothetical protein
MRWLIHAGMAALLASYVAAFWLGRATSPDIVSQVDLKENACAYVRTVGGDWDYTCMLRDGYQIGFMMSLSNE